MRENVFGKVNTMKPKDLWPKEFYEGELKGGQRADRMRAKQGALNSIAESQGTYYYRAGHTHNRLSTKVVNSWPEILYVKKNPRYLNKNINWPPTF